MPKFKGLKLNVGGMTLAEVLITAVVAMFLFAVTLSMWHFAYKRWAIDRVQTELRIGLEIGVEKIKEEVRLSSATYISLYKPGGETDYKAISFPMATPDVNGFFTWDDAESDIYWDTSVVYYAYDNPTTGNTEIRRAEFTNNHNTILDDSDRYDQLVQAVSDATGTRILPRSAQDAETQNADFTITPTSQEFDGYNATTKRSDNVEFGSVRLTSGNHTFKFEVTGQNADSSGYELGIDTLSITPSGCHREAEIYTPSATSGNTVSKVGPDIRWSGNHFLEYRADEVDDFVTLTMYYDAWIESNFDNTIRDNTIISGDDVYVKLPNMEEGKLGVWQAEIEAGSNDGDAVKADFATGLGNVTVRNLISSIDSDGDLVRIKLDSYSTLPLTITSAYIDERLSGEDCIDPPILGPPGSETRIRLYFTDASGNISTGVTIDPVVQSYAYSNWAIFPVDDAKQYFVTFHIDAANPFVSYWAGTDPTHINSYVMGPRETGGSYVAQATWSSLPLGGHNTPIPPPNDTYISSANTYAQATIEVYSDEGSVTTSVYDTSVDNPTYSTIVWDEDEPSGSSITVYGRSSDDEGMAGAVWAENSCGSDRYAQFMADLSTAPFWTCIDHSASVAVTDANYKNLGTITCSTCAKYLIPAVDIPWIDNIKTTWPGVTRMCSISGYFAQNPDYGIIKLTVDGEELVKSLEFNVSLDEVFQGTTYETSLSAGVEPRNTRTVE